MVVLFARGTLLAGIFAGLISAASAEGRSDSPSAPEPTSGPVQMIRTLRLLQDQIAVGSSEAHAGQRGLLAIFEERLMKLDADAWKDTGNVQAAVAFVWSGGSPKILRRLLSAGLISEDSTPLVEGALAYAEGREEEARRALVPIDVVRLPVAVAAQLALVQSALLIRTDAKKSMELLDFVRLQAPGTLLEEAAIRRQIFAVSHLEGGGKFETLVGEYLRRFRHSVYAGNFRERLAAALTRIDFAKDPERYQRLVATLKLLEPAVQNDLYLLAARTSVENGRLKSAMLIAATALSLSDGDEPAAMRAKLYQASAMIVSPKSLESGILELKGINRALLPASDQKLLDSALAMANDIKRLPGESTAEKKPAPVAQLSAEQQASEQLPALSKAQEALRSVDRLIRN